MGEFDYEVDIDDLLNDEEDEGGNNVETEVGESVPLEVKTEVNKPELNSAINKKLSERMSAVGSNPNPLIKKNELVAAETRAACIEIKKALKIEAEKVRGEICEQLREDLKEITDGLSGRFKNRIADIKDGLEGEVLKIELVNKAADLTVKSCREYLKELTELSIRHGSKLSEAQTRESAKFESKLVALATRLETAATYRAQKELDSAKSMWLCIGGVLSCFILGCGFALAKYFSDPPAPQAPVPIVKQQQR